MFYLTCSVFLLLNSICKEITSRRENKDLSQIFEKQQGFTNMGRLRQGKNILDAQARSRYILNENSKSMQISNMKDISKNPYLNLNYLFDNELKNDTLITRHLLEWVKKYEKDTEIKKLVRQTGNRNNNYFTLEHISNKENSTPNIDSLKESPQDKNNTKSVTHFKNVTEKVKQLNKPKERKKKLSTIKKTSSSESGLSNIEFILIKLLCTTTVESDTITKILECFNDTRSIKKIKYGAKVLINNKPKPDDIDFLRCLSRLTTYPETINQTKQKMHAKDCFQIHNINEQRLKSFLSKLITKRQEHDLEEFYNCLSKRAGENFKQHVQDCIEVNQILYEVTDHIKKTFLNNRTLTAPSALKTGKSFTSNLNDYVFSDDEKFDTQEGLKINFTGEFFLEANDGDNLPRKRDLDI